MKEIIYNHDGLKDKDITDTVIRIKGLIINDNNILIADQNGGFQFPGGHLEKNETFEECLKREILEETGISLEDSEFTKPFMKVKFMNKDYPEKGKNRKSEVYYYVIETNKTPDLSKTNYTEMEIKNHYVIYSFKLDEVIDKIKANMPNNEMNKIISPDMISAIEEYFKIKNYNK